VRELREKGNRAGQAAVPGMSRFGERIGRAAAASFRCAACGEMAAVVKVARAGTTVDMGPPLGRETYERDAVVVDYFFGTASRFADAATLDAVQHIVSSDAPDPVAQRRIDPELAPFFCPDCGLNYCRADWDTCPGRHHDPRSLPGHTPHPAADQPVHLLAGGPRPGSGPALAPALFLSAGPG
jgi:predicted RNA-binding Zn-ribbon protein involved in translation (DUF1610 family)